MIVLGLDLSWLTAGWAVVQDGAGPVPGVLGSGALKFDVWHERVDLGVQMARAQLSLGGLRDLLCQWPQIDAVAYETAKDWVMAKGRAPVARRKTSNESIMSVAYAERGLWDAVAAAGRQNVRLVDVNPNEWHAALLPSVFITDEVRREAARRYSQSIKAQKRTVMQFVAQYTGVWVATDHEADAIGVALYALDQLRLERQVAEAEAERAPARVTHGSSRRGRR